MAGYLERYQQLASLEQTKDMFIQVALYLLSWPQLGVGSF